MQALQKEVGDAEGDQAVLPMRKVPEVHIVQRRESANAMMGHISYSSVLLFLNNRSAWHKKYVLNIKDQLTNPSALTGSAFHKYMELTLKGQDKTTAYEAAQTMIRTTTEVEWGKTGSVDKCLSELESLVRHINKEMPEIHKIVAVEHESEVKVPGIKLPIKSFIDLVYEDKEGKIHILDWKTVKSYEEEETPAHVLQSVYYYWAVNDDLRAKPVDCMLFQLKASENKDGSDQSRKLVIDYSAHPEYIAAIKDITQRTVREMLKKKQFLVPNLRDKFEGPSEFKRYLTQFDYASPIIQHDTQGGNQAAGTG